MAITVLKVSSMKRPSSILFFPAVAPSVVGKRWVFSFCGDQGMFIAVSIIFGPWPLSLMVVVATMVVSFCGTRCFFSKVHVITPLAPLKRLQ